METKIYDPECNSLKFLNELPEETLVYEMANQVKKLARESGEGMEGDTLRLETQIQGFQSIHPWHAKKKQNPRFAPMMEWNNGSVWPDMRIMENLEAREYLHSRLLTVTHPALKAWYADFIWELDKDCTAARQAIEAYIRHAEILTSKGKSLHAADALTRAVEIGLAIRDEESYRNSFRILLNKAIEMAEQDDLNTCLLFAWGIFHVRKAGSQADAMKVANLLEQSSDKLTEGLDETHLAERCLRSAADFYCAFKDDSGRRTILRKLGELLETRGTMLQEHSHLLAASTFKDAATAFQESGDRGKADEMRTRMRAQGEAAAKTEFASFGVDLDWPQKAIEQAVTELQKMPLESAVMTIASTEQLIPKWASAEKHWEAAAKEAVFLQLVNPQVIREGITVWTAHLPEEIQEYNIMRGFSMAAQYGAAIAAETLTKTLNDHPSAASALSEVLMRQLFFMKTDRELLNRGLGYFFNKDWIGTIYIVAPYIENLLRSLLGAMGLATFVPARECKGAFREKSLNMILETLEIRNLLGKDMWWYLWWALVDPRGPQLRHQAAHGLLKSAECTPGNAALLIHLLLLLARYKRKQVEEN